MRPEPLLGAPAAPCGPGEKQITLQDLRNLFDEKGIEAADRALEEAGLPQREESDFLEALNAWNLERQRRWTHPSRYPAAYDPHTF